MIGLISQKAPSAVATEMAKRIKERSDKQDIELFMDGQSITLGDINKANSHKVVVSNNKIGCCFFIQLLDELKRQQIWIKDARGFSTLSIDSSATPNLSKYFEDGPFGIQPCQIANEGSRYYIYKLKERTFSVTFNHESASMFVHTRNKYLLNFADLMMQKNK